MSELKPQKGRLHRTLSAIENALGSWWIGPLSLGILASHLGWDLWTVLLLTIIYVSFGNTRTKGQDSE